MTAHIEWMTRSQYSGKISYLTKPNYESGGNLKKLCGEVAVKGFRPGKTPIAVVRQRYGEGIRAEVVSELMRSQLFDALTEKDINPVNSPFVDVITNTPGQDLVFTATFEVLPTHEMINL